eukprot:TRINITY_DN11117_c0_g2_i1.p1 TRINITY_DN11117_c0_g2~~TRINITY_DN11117_c0_g2_i1.p1  ORF type:complete len:104 (-),score=10.48 TRINITY_DN11117_c0_g2_i1:121-432(-)
MNSAVHNVDGAKRAPRSASIPPRIENYAKRAPRRASTPHKIESDSMQSIASASSVSTCVCDPPFCKLCATVTGAWPAEFLAVGSAPCSKSSLTMLTSFNLTAE